MSAPIYVVLLHYPMSNRNGEVVVTSVTNLDIHDISRTARTYGSKGFFLVTPLKEQHEVVNRILGHWQSPSSKIFHPDRVEALKLVRLVSTFDAVKTQVQAETGMLPEVVLTDACAMSQSVSYQELSSELLSSKRDQPVVIVFGTGWGVAKEFYPEVHRVLDPINGVQEPNEVGFFNHLSVRSAVAIILDRLVGEESFGRNLQKLKLRERNEPSVEATRA